MYGTMVSTDVRLKTLLAVSAKMVLEYLVHNMQRLRNDGVPISESVDNLLKRTRKPGY